MSTGPVGAPRAAAPPARSRRSGSNAVLAAGLAVLALGAAAFFVLRTPAAPAPSPSAGARPRFEVAYADMPVDVYRSLLQPPPDAESPIPGVAGYRVHPTEVARRIADDPTYLRVDSLVPPLPTDGGDEDDFGTMYARGAVRLGGAGVVCLIVKQVGRGDADSVFLDLYRVRFPRALDVYDPTDVDAYAPAREGEHIYGPADVQAPFDSLRIALGRVATGEAVVVPLYATLDFRSAQGEQSWSVIKRTALVPANLGYGGPAGPGSVRVRSILGQAIVIRGPG